MSSRVQQRLQIRSTSRPRYTSRVGTFRTYDEKPHLPTPEGCNCERPYGTVFCKSCGWTYREGRVRTPCPVHSRTMYLLDIEQCLKCKAFPPILTEIH